MGQFRTVDLAIVGLYFSAMAAMGWYFSMRTKTTEDYFVGGRAYPGWLIGVSLFGATISSITFVAYPADAFKTAYLRYLLCIMMPLGVFIASYLFLPFFRRGKVTSVFEYLESRFGPRVRVYGASVFIVSQCIRISIIQYLVALLTQQLTGWDPVPCILLGGAITAYYTVIGGIEAVLWTDFVQSMILSAGGLVILGAVLWELPGGLGQLLSVASENHKFMLGDLDTSDGMLHPAPWGFSLSQKTVTMMLILGLLQWLAEYSMNQEIVQKYCAAKSARDARWAMWICCLCSVPTWGYFMFLGTGLFVFYQVHPDAQADAMLSGARKAEDVLPYFLSTQIPPGISGLVVAAVLAAAMSSMSSAMNSISAVAITDIYRRHWRLNEDETHYVRAARLVTLASAVIMVAGAYLLFFSEKKTLQHLATELTAILSGGLLGVYMLGFFSVRGDGRAVGLGLAFAVAFSLLISLAQLGWLPAIWIQALESHFDTYYTGLIGNVVTFVLGYAVGCFLPARDGELPNLTVWTQDSTPLD